jgi:hypothetical protein
MRGYIIRPEKITGLTGHYRPYQSTSYCKISLICGLFRSTSSYLLLQVTKRELPGSVSPHSCYRTEQKSGDPDPQLAQVEAKNAEKFTLLQECHETMGLHYWQLSVEEGNKLIRVAQDSLSRLFPHFPLN